MPWEEVIDSRTQRSKLFTDGNKRARTIGLSQIHYETEVGSGIYDEEIDLEIKVVDNVKVNGWMVDQNGWHYALGEPKSGVFNGQDGTVGFGGRKGQNWVQFRLMRVGYLHYPTRAWQDIGGSPTYNRSRLTDELITKTFLDGSIVNRIGKATWERIWATPSGGQVDIQWVIRGGDLKEDIILNQAGRDWIAANAPPTTPINETYFGFVYQLDPSDIPKWVKNGILQNIDGDFDDLDYPIEIRDSLDRLLAFMPINYVSVKPQVITGYDPNLKKVLRKRIYKDGANWYILVGIRVDELLTMPDGDLKFDPSWSTSITNNLDDGYQDPNGDWDANGFDLSNGLADWIGDFSGVVMHAGYSWQLVDDLSAVDSIDKVYISLYCLEIYGSPPNAAIRVQNSVAARWSASNLPSAASWVNARAGAALTHAEGTRYWGEGETFAQNLNADVETLTPEIGDWINICIFSPAQTGSDQAAYEDYNESGGNEATLYLEWTVSGAQSVTTQEATAILNAITASRTVGGVSHTVQEALIVSNALNVSASTVVTATAQEAIIALNAINASRTIGGITASSQEAVAILNAIDAGRTVGAVVAVAQEALMNLVAINVSGTSAGQAICLIAEATLNALNVGRTVGAVARTAQVALSTLVGVNTSVSAIVTATCDIALATLNAITASRTVSGISASCEVGVASLLAINASVSPGAVTRITDVAIATLNAINVSGVSGQVGSAEVASILLNAIDASRTVGEVTAICEVAIAYLTALNVSSPDVWSLGDIIAFLRAFTDDDISDTRGYEYKDYIDRVRRNR